MIPFPDKKYNIIYADPPWAFRVWDRDTGHGRSAESHYPTMSIEEICDLPVTSIAAENTVLFMWVTMPMLIIEAPQVINAWGFEYKTCAFVWIKTNKRANPDQLVIAPDEMFNFDDFMGMGYWTRANAELCLLATRGKPKRRAASVRQIIYAPIEAHSKKPAETRDRIIKLMGDLPRIELFARQAVPGWDAWGNEVGKLDGNVQQRLFKEVQP